MTDEQFDEALQELEERARQAAWKHNFLALRDQAERDESACQHRQVTSASPPPRGEKRLRADTVLTAREPPKFKVDLPYCGYSLKEHNTFIHQAEIYFCNYPQYNDQCKIDAAIGAIDNIRIM